MSIWSPNGETSSSKSRSTTFERSYTTQEQKQQPRNLNCGPSSGTFLGGSEVDKRRHSHRDLLKTANTVIEMREILDDVDIQYRRLMTYSPEVISTQAINAEGYQKQVTSSAFDDNIDFRRK